MQSNFSSISEAGGNGSHQSNHLGLEGATGLGRTGLDVLDVALRLILGAGLALLALAPVAVPAALARSSLVVVGGSRGGGRRGRALAGSGGRGRRGVARRACRGSSAAVHNNAVAGAVGGTPGGATGDERRANGVGVLLDVGPARISNCSDDLENLEKAYQMLKITASSVG